VDSLTSPRRNRIINDIRSLDQALKVEKNVASAYGEMIKENISYWLAVEQDLIDSYSTMIGEAKDSTISDALTRIIEDSRGHVEVLESMMESFSKMVRDEERHAKALEEFQNSA
jgi:bacterioferritin (cytochrome b1)